MEDQTPQAPEKSPNHKIHPVKVFEDEETPEYPVIYFRRTKGRDNKVGRDEKAELFQQIGKLKIEQE